MFCRNAEDWVFTLSEDHSWASGLVIPFDADFYDKDNGSNYAVARYFCMYMQEQGVLEKFYKKFRSNIKKDPTRSSPSTSSKTTRHTAIMQRNFSMTIPAPLTVTSHPAATALS